MEAAEAVGVRDLTVLGEFKPFGLTVEAMDGESPDNAGEKYDYFLFDPDIARSRDEFVFPQQDLACGGDHEVFVRGSRLIWSSGSSVHKRYSCSSPILMACWCRMNASLDAFLCVLQSSTLSIYEVSGEVISVPLPHAIASIWPLPFGLLLQKAIDGTPAVNLSFSSSSSTLTARDLSRHNREFLSNNSSSSHDTCDHSTKDDFSIISSHLILKNPSEEPQALFLEEKGKLSVIQEHEERIIWTSDVIPLLVSYHSGKMKHSIWIVEAVNDNLEADSTSFQSFTDRFFSKQYIFRRIWQATCSQFAATKVFLASDDDKTPILCFLLQEQKVLLSVRLQIDEMNEALIDVKPLLSWSIPAIDAAPVTVSRLGTHIARLPCSDILVLTSDSSLLLYLGKQCLCRYTLPLSSQKELLQRNVDSFDVSKAQDLGIRGITDAVLGKINLVTHNGMMFRCKLRSHPCSSLVNDCIMAFSEGLQLCFYNLFCVQFWGTNNSDCLSKADGCIDSEWEFLVNVIMKIAEQCQPSRQKESYTLPETCWSYLLNSNFHSEYGKHALIPCLSLENTFHSKEAGQSIVDLPDGRSRDKSSYGQFLLEILDTLHALYESLKLDNLRKHDLELLVNILYRVAASLGETCYTNHYIRDFPGILLNVQCHGSTSATRIPPSIFNCLEDCLRHGCHFAGVNNLPPLLCNAKASALSFARKIISFYSLLLGASRAGRKLSSGVYCDIAKGSSSTREEVTVLAMIGEEFGLRQLDLLPAGVSLPLRHALDKCREFPPTDWPPAAYVLVGREDLAMACLASPSKRRGEDSHTIGSLISISTPYMSHLQPVTVPSSTSDIAKMDELKLGDSESLKSSSEDGMDYTFNSSTQLRFGRDLRSNEVRRLLCSSRPVAVQTSVNTSTSDQDLHQHNLWNLAQRTMALPLGRGAFTLATTYTLLTEALAVPKLVLAGRLPSQQNATVNLDPNLRNIAECRFWPEFHNGVAAGLRLTPSEGKVSRTWIHYNKPEQPNNTHAGVLLALGLHGHLSVLTITDVFRYLTQEHDVTTIAVLLGMGASYRGAMHPAVSKLLYVHIPFRPPSAFPELELPTQLQTAALVAVGLLYEGSAHPLTMKILMSEIGRRSSGDNVLEREGYALAAGAALGLVGLGRGQNAFGVMDSFVDQLFHYAGGNKFYNDKTSKLGQMIDGQSKSAAHMMDGIHVNIDVTAPGAIVALALIFLKTESEAIASRFSIPATHSDLQNVRPDFIMLRIIARNLIMWNRILPSRQWIEAQIPEIVKVGTSKINYDNDDMDDIDMEAVVQAYVNVVTGACISVGLRYAGSRNASAQELLYSYAVYFLNEMKPACGASCASLPKGLLRSVDRGTLEIALHLIVLSLSVVMAGSGHLKIFRLLRYLRSRSSPEGHVSYGVQMAISMAIGFLFLSGGTQTFSTGNSAIAALLISLYPRLPSGPNDNRCHLQAFRHLYVIAAESRWLQTVDVDTGLMVYVPLEVTVSETEQYAETSFCEITPCILPERATLKSIRVCGPRYWPHVVQLMPEEKPWWRPADKNDPLNGGFLHVKRKVGACSYLDDPIGCQSLLSRVIHIVSESSPQGGCNKDMNATKVDQLVTTFSADPSLVSFAQLCCDTSWSKRSDANFQEFCSQVLFECVSRERPALLQVYLSLYTNVGLMLEEVYSGQATHHDSLFLFSFKIAIAYNDAVNSGKMTCTKDGIVQPTFIESLRKRVDDILAASGKLRMDFFNYLNLGEWPTEEDDIRALLLSWYLQWYRIPDSHTVKSALQRIGKKKTCSGIPLLRLVLPRTSIHAIKEIDNLRPSLSI